MSAVKLTPARRAAVNFARELLDLDEDLQRIYFGHDYQRKLEWLAQFVADYDYALIKDEWLQTIAPPLNELLITQQELLSLDSNDAASIAKLAWCKSWLAWYSRQLDS